MAQPWGLVIILLMKKCQRPEFFLPWCAGEFEKNGRRMIVSRGMGTHSINIRLNNLPQLIAVHLKRE